MPKEIAEYLEREFRALHEYLNDGEGIEEFLLPYHQRILILESEAELQKVLNHSFDIEFVDEVILKKHRLSRIGIYQAEEVQICYSIHKE